VTIDIDGKQHLAQVREKQRDFIKNRLVNLEFQFVSLTEKMWPKVGIELTGTAPAVKNFNTVIHTGLTAMEVECMPQDLLPGIGPVLDGSKSGERAGRR
jgi:large subunit ribosomal protein L25